MKAVDWLKCLEADGIKVFLEEYLQETKNLLKTRDADSVIREQRQKFIAISKRTDKVSVDMFDDVMMASIPKTWDAFCRIQSQQLLRQHYRAISARRKKVFEDSKNESDPQIRLGMLIAAIINADFERQEARELYEA